MKYGQKNIVTYVDSIDVHNWLDDANIGKLKLSFASSESITTLPFKLFTCNSLPFHIELSYVVHLPTDKIKFLSSGFCYKVNQIAGNNTKRY